MIQVSDIQQCYSVFKKIPEFSQYLTIEEIYSRIGGRNFLSLIYVVDGKPVAFKLGYELNKSEFYSWLGGVEPSYRSRGLAKELLLAQENWAREQGYSTIRVKSMNEFPAMLCMLISNGYHIDDLSNRDADKKLKIHFYKNLNV